MVFRVSETFLNSNDLQTWQINCSEFFLACYMQYPTHASPFMDFSYFLTVILTVWHKDLPRQLVKQLRRALVEMVVNEVSAWLCQLLRDVSFLLQSALLDDMPFL